MKMFKRICWAIVIGFNLLVWGTALYYKVVPCPEPQIIGYAVQRNGETVWIEKEELLPGEPILGQQIDQLCPGQSFTFEGSIDLEDTQSDPTEKRL